MVANNKVVSLEDVKIACKNCNLNSLCLPMGLGQADVEKLDAIIRRGRPIHRGDYLFRGDDPFHSIYVVKTGSVKSYIPADDGGEHVLGFHLPGELIGLDAIEEGRYHCSARVLETSAVCEIPFARLEELSALVPNLQHQLFRLLSKEISQDTDMVALLGSKNAEERLASFLLGMSARLQRRGFSGSDFYLSMSRNEIGSYLGLAVETVSRLFTRFHDEGLLNVERKHVQLADLEGLRKIVEGSEHFQGKKRRATTALTFQ